MEGQNRDYVILIILLVSSEVLLFVCIPLYRQHTTCRKKKERGKRLDRCTTVARNRSYSTVAVCRSILIDEETFLNRMLKGVKKNVLWQQEAVCRTHWKPRDTEHVDKRWERLLGTRQAAGGQSARVEVGRQQGGDGGWPSLGFHVQTGLSSGLSPPLHARRTVKSHVSPVGGLWACGSGRGTASRVKTRFRNKPSQSYNQI